LFTVGTGWNSRPRLDRSSRSSLKGYGWSPRLLGPGLKIVEPGESGKVIARADNNELLDLPAVNTSVLAERMRRAPATLLCAVISSAAVTLSKTEDA
jgi:hypothetical protein